MPWQLLTPKSVRDRIPTVSITPRNDVYLSRPSVKLAESHIGPIIGRRFSIMVDTHLGLAILAPDKVGWTMTSRRSDSAVLSRAMSRQVPRISPGLYLMSIVYVDDLRELGKVPVFAYTSDGERLLAEAIGELESGRAPMTIVSAE